MKSPTITILTHRMGGRFVANAGHCEVIDESATLAARAAAAKHFQVSEDQIELVVLDSDHPEGRRQVLRASAHIPVVASNTDLLVAAGVCTAAAFVCWLVFVWKGGAR